MILPDFKAFPRSGRLIGIDWGARRTGVAVSDATRDFIFVRPPIVMPRGDADYGKRIADLARVENAVGIVFGLPIHANGTESDTAAHVRAAAVAVCEYIDLPIVFIPENLTSVSAQENMGRVRVRDIKERLDSESARVILENAISVLRRIK